MSTTNCQKCGKIRTAKIQTCPYCSPAQRASKLNLFILIFAISAAVSVVMIISGSKSGKKLVTVTSKKTVKAKSNNADKGVSFSQIVGLALKSSSVPKITPQISSIPESEDIAQVETYEDANEVFTENITFTEAAEVDSFEGAATETVDTTVEELSEKDIRKKYWEEFYQKKFTLPNAGADVAVQLKNGSSKSGKFMGVVNQFVKLMINDKLESISKSKLSKRSQLRYFYSDYVNYCTGKKLAEEGLN